MSLFVRLLVWVILFDVSFSLLLLPFVDGDIWQAASEAGSAMFTLGYAAPSNVGNTMLVYAAAYTGLMVIALQVGICRRFMQPSTGGGHPPGIESRLTCMGTGASGAHTVWYGRANQYQRAQRAIPKVGAMGR
jgi:hypothetical protein